MTKYIRIIKKQNICEVTFNLSIAVKVTIILFLCGLLNCIRADLFMNNALYKCCIITHHSLRCIAQRSGKKMVPQVYISLPWLGDRTILANLYRRHPDDMGTSAFWTSSWILMHVYV